MAIVAVGSQCKRPGDAFVCTLHVALVDRDASPDVLADHERLCRVQERVVPDDTQGILDESHRATQRRLVECPGLLPRPEIALVRERVVEWPFSEPPALLRAEGDLEGIDDRSGELLL